MKERYFGVVYHINRTIMDQKVREEDEKVREVDHRTYTVCIEDGDVEYYSTGHHTGMVAVLDEIRRKGRACGRHSDKRFDKKRKKEMDHRHRPDHHKPRWFKDIGNSASAYAYAHRPARGDEDWAGNEEFPQYALPEQTPRGDHAAREQKLHQAAEAIRNLRAAQTRYEEAMRNLK